MVLVATGKDAVVLDSVGTPLAVAQVEDTKQALLGIVAEVLVSLCVVLLVLVAATGAHAALAEPSSVLQVPAAASAVAPLVLRILVAASVVAQYILLVLVVELPCILPPLEIPFVLAACILASNDPSAHAEFVLRTDPFQDTGYPLCDIHRLYLPH